jgi:hypothetical protein
MTDREFESIRERIKTAVEKWLPALGLKWWHEILISYDRERFSEERNGHPADCAGFTKVNWEYLDAHVTFSVACIWAKELSDEEIDYLVRHELCHILVNEMRMWGPPTHRDEQARDEAIKHEERVVTQLAQAIKWVWDAAFKAGSETIPPKSETEQQNHETNGGSHETR